MTGQITYLGNYGYEIHKNGLFWKTYIYKKETDLNYLLVDTVRTLVEPEIKQLHDKSIKMLSSPGKAFPAEYQLPIWNGTESI